MLHIGKSLTFNSIQRTVDYFQEVKKDIQKQLATAGHNTDKNFVAARIKYEVASNLVADAEKARAAQGKSMPLPVFDREDRSADAHHLPRE